MLDPIGGVTVAAVKLALDAAVLRHQVIANNVANAETPDFTPMRLDFAGRLDAALAGFVDVRDDAALGARIEQLSERLASPDAIRRDGDGPVELDAQMVELADNSLRYQALLAGLGKQMAILRAAIHEGRP